MSSELVLLICMTMAIFVLFVDTRKAKRVRFEDSGRDGAPVLASSGEGEAIQPSKCRFFSLLRASFY